jgi:hypothetical protein
MKKSKLEIQNRFLTRRQFLTNSSSAFLAIPPLLSLMPSMVAAQVAAQKKVRSVIYTGYLGIDYHQLVPKDDPAGLMVAPGAIHTRYKTLQSFGGPVSRMIDSSFMSMYPHMNVLKGLSLTGGRYQGHNVSVISGTHSGGREPLYGKSIDVIMEQSANVYKTSEVIKLKALRIGGSGMSFDRVGGTRIQSGTTQGDSHVFNKLFGGFIAPTATTDPTLSNQKKINSKLIVDQVYDDLKKLENNSRISSSDKIILDRYITSIHELQQKVQANSSGSAPTCSVPSLPLDATTTGAYSKFPEEPSWNVQNTSAVFDNYIEMIKLAFMCDLTRVVYMENSIWSDLPISPSSNGGLHHECASSDVAADRQQWGLKKMLKLAQALQSTLDPQGGTLLDNSSILFTNELGAWTTAHNVLSMPAVLFGRGGGLFKTGYFVDYTQLPKTTAFGGNYGTSPGRPFKQLLQSIMQSMGVPKSEYIQFGDGKGFGEFNEGIFQNNRNAPTVYSAYRNEHNDLLPLVTG